MEIQSFERQTNDAVMDLTNDDGTQMKGPTIQKTKWLINEYNFIFRLKDFIFLGIERRKNLLLLVKMMRKQRKLKQKVDNGFKHLIKPMCMFNQNFFCFK